MKFDIERIYKLLKDSKKNQSDFLVDAGLSKGVVSHWSKRNNPKIEQLEKLLNYYGKSVLEVYKLNKLDSEYIIQNLDSIIETIYAKITSEQSNGQIINKTLPTQFAPLIGSAAANPTGRWGIDFEKDLGDTVKRYPVPPGKEDPNGFWIHVEGDSMEPKIPDGSAVYVSPNRRIEPNSIAFFRINEQTLIKKVVFVPDKNHFFLHSINKKYEPILIDPQFQEIQQSGAVLAIMLTP